MAATHRVNSSGPHPTARQTRLGLVSALLVAAPVLLGIGYAVAGALGSFDVNGSAISARRIVHVLDELVVWQSIAFTLWYAAAATFLASAAAIFVAIVFRGHRRSGRVAQWLAVAPLPVPYVVAAAVGLLLLGQSGVVSRLAYALGWSTAPVHMPVLVYDRAGTGLIMTLAWKEFPFLALVTFSLLATRVVVLEEAARTLGATTWQAFARVTWPLLWRGLLPAVTAVFVFVIGSYEVAALLGPSNPVALPVLTLERYNALDLSHRADAYVLSLLGMVIALLAVALHEWTRAAAERLNA